MTAIQRNYSNLIEKANSQAIFSFSQFGTLWGSVDDKNPRAQEFLMELLQTATSKLCSCVRLYRTWHTKESFTAAETLSHLKDVEALYKRTIDQNRPRLYQFARSALDLQPSGSLPVLPMCFEEAQENFQILVDFLFQDTDGETIQSAIKYSSYGWREMVWQTVYPKYLNEILSTIDSLIHQDGFFTKSNEAVEVKLGDIRDRLAQAKDKNTVLELEEELKALFAMAFSQPPSGRGYGPSLNHRMKHLASLNIPKRCEGFFEPLFQKIFVEHLKRIRQLKYRDMIPAVLMQALRMAVEEAPKPYRVEVGDFKAPEVLS